MTGDPWQPDPEGDERVPVVIGFVASQLASGEWTASAAVLAEPDTPGTARHVVVTGESREAALRALVRRIAELTRDAPPDAEAHSAD